MAPTANPEAVVALADPSPPLSVAVVAPYPPPTVPSAKGSAACGLRCPPAHLPIGRHAAPVLVAPVQEIERDGLDGDGNIDSADLQAATLSAQARNDAAGGVETEQRAAGQHDGIDAGHRHFRLEQGGIARARRAAPDHPGGDVRGIDHDDRHAGSDPRVMRIADADAGQVGDQIIGCAQGLPRSKRRRRNLARERRIVNASAMPKTKGRPEDRPQNISQSWDKKPPATTPSRSS